MRRTKKKKKKPLAMDTCDTKVNTILIKTDKRSWHGLKSQEVGGERGSLYLTLHCHHQNDSAFRWAAASLLFAVSLTAEGKVIRPCPLSTTVMQERKEDVRPNCKVKAFSSFVLRI